VLKIPGKGQGVDDLREMLATASPAPAALPRPSLSWHDRPLFRQRAFPGSTLIRGFDMALHRLLMQ
jgi:hypothetical protein